MAAARFHTYREPMERDIHIYAVTAHEMLKGRLLFTDLWVNTPPAIFITYALGEKIAGYGPFEFYLLWLLAASVTLVAVYSAGRVMGEVGGLWAAVFWAASCTDLMLEANEPNTEVFVIALQASAFALAVWGHKPMSLVRCGCIGLLGGLSACYKHPMLIFPILLALGSGLAVWKNRKWKLDIPRLILFVLPSFLFWALTFIYFAIHNRFQDCWDALVTYDSYLAGSIWHHLAKGLIPGLMFYRDIRWILWPLLILTTLLAGRFYKMNYSYWKVLVAYGIAVFIETNASGHWFPHYFQLGLPVLMVAGGWSAALLWRISTSRAFFLPSIALLLILYHEIPFYFLSADQWSTKRYEATFVDAQRLGTALDKVLLPEETFYHFGNELGIYFASRRDPPTGAYCAWFLKEGPMVGQLSNRLKADLKNKKPEAVVIDQKRYPENASWFEKEYRVWQTYPEDGHFLVMVRKGGELEKRIQNNPQLGLY